MPSPCSTSFPPARIQSGRSRRCNMTSRSRKMSTRTPKITQEMRYAMRACRVPGLSPFPRIQDHREARAPSRRWSGVTKRGKRITGESDLCMLCRHMRINPVSDRHSASFHAHRGKLMLAPGASSTAAGRVVAILSAAPVATLVNEGIGYDASGNVLLDSNAVTGALVLAGIARNATGAMFGTITVSASDMELGGLRISITGQLVIVQANPATVLNRNPLDANGAWCIQ